MDPVAALAGGGHGPQDQHDHAFRPDIAVGRGVERPAETGGRQHGGPRESHEREGREQEIGPGHDRGVDLALLDRVDRQAEGDERGGAGRVDGEARAVEVEIIGQPVRDDAERIARHHVDVGRRRIGEEARAVIHGRRADIDPGVGSGQGGGPDAGMGQRVVRDFQEVSLLRVDLFGLARAHAEGAGVEAPDVVDQPGREGVALARLVRRGMIEGLSGETVARDGPDGAAIVLQQGPERIGIARAWQTPRISDNGYFCLVRHYDISPRDD